MGINFDGLGATPQTTTETPTTAVDRTLSIDMGKNMTLDLTKRNPGLKSIRVGAGWDIANTGTDFDLDLFALLLTDGKLTSTSNLVFFNAKESHGVKLLGDNRTGVGEGDDETILVNLPQVEANINEIVICIDIFSARERSQTFGQVSNSYIRLINDETSVELCNFRLKDDFSVDTAVIVAKLKRNGGEWDFETIAEGKQADIQDIVNLYV